jgi:DNA-directed RNA polymerase subunit K/omega
MAALKSSIEVYNIDDALAVFGNNQFQLILAASIRSREIATQRTFQERNGVKMTYENKSNVTALYEIANGTVGKEYLNKVR